MVFVTVAVVCMYAIFIFLKFFFRNVHLYHICARTWAAKIIRGAYVWNTIYDKGFYITNETSYVYKSRTSYSYHYSDIMLVFGKSFYIGGPFTGSSLELNYTSEKWSEKMKIVCWWCCHTGFVYIVLEHAHEASDLSCWHSPAIWKTRENQHK